MTGLQTLRQLDMEAVRAKHPTLPIECIAPSKYKDSTANGLTKCIVSYITLMGGWATRVTTTGQMRATGKTEVSPGTLKWVYGTTKRVLQCIPESQKDDHSVFSVQIRIQ